MAPPRAPLQTGPPDWRFAVLREKSCGIVPYREVDGEILYLVISSAVTKREHWEFPKGGVEEGEREIETALRELWEETGVKEVRVLPGYREPIRYIYRRPEGLVSKQVVYFIARVANPAVKLREVEAKDYRWANYDEARKLLRHANARALLERCHAFITGKPLPTRLVRAPARPARPDGLVPDAEAQRRRGKRRRGQRDGRGPATKPGEGAKAAEAVKPGEGAKQAEAPKPVAAATPAAAAKPVEAAKPQQKPGAGDGAAAGERPWRRKRRRRRGGRRGAEGRGTSTGATPPSRDEPT